MTLLAVMCERTKVRCIDCLSHYFRPANDCWRVYYLTALYNRGSMSCVCCTVVIRDIMWFICVWSIIVYQPASATTRGAVLICSCLCALIPVLMTASSAPSDGRDRASAVGFMSHVHGAIIPPGRRPIDGRVTWLADCRRVRVIPGCV